MGSISSYFDLNFRGSKPLQVAEQESKVPVYIQLIFYIGTVIGVLFSEVIREASEGTTLTEVEFSVNMSALLIASFIGIMIIPQIYDKLTINRKAPFIVQFGLFVQNGIFWDTTLIAISKAIGA